MVLGIYFGTFFREVSVEPVLFLYMLSTFTQYAVFQDLVYSRVCLEKYAPVVCDDLYSAKQNSSKEVLDYVQATSSHWILLATASTIVPSIFISVYLGSWSDRFGPKWPVTIPPLGGALGSFVYILIAAEPNIPVGCICVASLVTGLTGGFTSCMMSCATYISSTTKESQRTMRLSRLEAMTFLGGTLGPFISGVFLSLLGQGYAFLFMMVLYLVGFFYVVLFVSDIPGRVVVSSNFDRSDYNPSQKLPGKALVNGNDNKASSGTFSGERTPTTVTPEERSPLISTSNSTIYEQEEENLFRNNRNLPNSEPWYQQYFGSKHFVESISTCCKKRENGKRGLILSILLAAFVTMIITAGEPDVSFLFVRDEPLRWSPTLYSYYFGFKYGIGALVLLLGMPICHRLKLPDAVVCVIGILSRMAGLICFGLSTSATMVFFAPFAAMFSFFTVPTMRAMLSKLVHPNEQGKMFAFVAIVEDICTLSASGLFNGLYPLTRQIFHGFIFQAAAFLLLLPLTILWYIHKKTSGSSTNPENLNKIMGCSE